MRAGTLRHRIEIQRKGEATDADGHVTDTWAPLATRYGSVEYMSGAERWRDERVDPRADMRVRLRYYEGLTVKDRLVSGTRVFNIIAIDDVLAMHRELVCYCTEDV